MSLKICLGQDIHKLSKLPMSFKELNKTLADILKEKLPKNYTMHYIDHESDDIILDNENDYQNMLSEFKGSNAVKSVKITIISPEVPLPGLNKTKSDDFQVVEKEDYVEIVCGQLQEMTGNTSKPLQKNELEDYIKNNLDLIVGKVANKFQSKEAEYKKLLQEFVNRYKKLNEFKRAEVNGLFNGIPKRMLNLIEEEAKDEEKPLVMIDKAKYTTQVIQNAEKLKTIYSEADLVALLEFCSLNSKLTMAELADQFAYQLAVSKKK
jgi:hypothetical protein